MTNILNCDIIFYSSFVVFQDYSMGKNISEDTCSHGLYSLK